MNESFVTGSQAYGTPTSESDVDLAIFLPSPHYDLFLGLFADEAVVPLHYNAVSNSLRFGKLNLLIFTDEVRFNAWKLATAELIKAKPVARDIAVEAIKTKVSELERVKA